MNVEIHGFSGRAIFHGPPAVPERPQPRQVRIHQRDAFPSQNGRRKLSLSCRFVDGARERTR